MEGDAVFVGGETSCRKEANTPLSVHSKQFQLKSQFSFTELQTTFSFTRKNRIQKMLTYYIEPLIYRKYHERRNKFSHVTGTQLAKPRLQEAWRTT